MWWESIGNAWILLMMESCKRFVVVVVVVVCVCMCFCWLFMRKPVNVSFCVLAKETCMVGVLVMVSIYVKLQRRQARTLCVFFHLVCTNTKQVFAWWAAHRHYQSTRSACVLVCSRNLQRTRPGQRMDTDLSICAVSLFPIACGQIVSEGQQRTATFDQRMPRVSVFFCA